MHTALVRSAVAQCGSHACACNCSTWVSCGVGPAYLKGGGGVPYTPRASALVGTSGCAHWFELFDTNCWETYIYIYIYIYEQKVTGGKKFLVGVARLSLFSEKLLLPFGVPRCRCWHASYKVDPKTVRRAGA